MYAEILAIAKMGITVQRSGESSEQDLPDADSVFAINSGTDSDSEIDSECRTCYGDDSVVGIDPGIAICFDKINRIDSGIQIDSL